MNEAVRVAVVGLAFANVGFVVAIYGRIGLYLVPRAPMRFAMAANMGIMAVIGLSNLGHIHRPIVWTSWALLVCLAVKGAGLLGLFEWYGTEEGKAHAETVRRSVAERDG